MSDLDLKDIKKAVEDVNVAFEAFKETSNANEKSRDAVTEEKLAKIEASMDAAQKVADEAILAAKRDSRIVTDENGDKIDLDAKAQDWAVMSAKRRGHSAQDFDAKQMEDYKNLYGKYLREGKEMMDSAELKALSVGSDPDGGYTVHPDTSGRVTSRVFETSPMRAYASVQVISTDSLEGTYDNDEAGSGWVGESAARTTTSTPQIGEWSIPVHELYANPKATQKLLDDTSINIEGWLANKVGMKFGRDETTAMVTGNGVAKPRGFLSYSDYAVAGVFENGKIEQFATGVNGDFAVAPAGYDILLDTVHGLKSMYHGNANWFMNRSTLGAARKEKDSNGDFLWVPGAVTGAPSTLLGYPIAPFEDMPAIATGSLSIAFGDMREAYQIVDRQGVRTLRDPFSDKPFVQFYTTKRVGGDVVNFEALKLVDFT